MKAVIVFLCAVALTQAIHSEWKQFKLTHERIYDSPEEESYRFQVFGDNMKKIKEHNAKYDAGLETYYLGVTPFADFTEEEYVETTSSLGQVPEVNMSDVSSLITNVGLPESVDWRTKGAVTPVRDQLPCGASYAFAALSCLESLHFLRTGKLQVLSAQNLVDCSSTRPYNNHGCHDGYMDRAYNYIKDKGIMLEDDYHYVFDEGSACLFDPKKKSEVRVTGFQMVPGEQNLQTVVGVLGPVSAGVDGKEWQHYVGGVFVSQKPLGKLSHAVTVVGYGHDADTGRDYYLVKNSYGRFWGEEGYMRLARNMGNQCGIANAPVIPTF